MKNRPFRSLVCALALSALVLSSCATVSKMLEMGGDQAYGEGGTIASAAPLMRAIKLRDYSRALSLVSQGVGEGEYVVSPKDATPLELAVAHRRLDVVKAIVDRGWFDQESGERALIRAAELEQPATVDYLIAKGCTVGSSYKLYALALQTPSHAVMSLFFRAPHSSYNVNNFGNGYGTADPGPFLVQASLHGYADLVEQAIQQQAKTESSACLSGYIKATPLWAASAMGHADCVRLLLAAGAKVDAAVSEYKYTPLMMAARGGYADVCKLLIEAGANINAKSATAFVSDFFMGSSTINYTRNDVKQRSPILFATSSGSFPTVKALIDAGVDVNQPNDEGWTAMLAARADLRADLASALLKAGATEHPLMGAIYAGSAAALRKELPNLTAFLAAQKLAIYPLTMAVRWHAITKSYEIVDLLLERRQDLPKEDMETALRAAKKENPELYRYLLDKGGLKEEYPDYAPSTYELLLERVAANDTGGFKTVYTSPSAKLGMFEKKQILEDAIMASRLDIVRFLLAEGYALNAMWPTHRDSMLGDAAISGSLDMVKLLLDSGAELEPKLASVGLELYPYRTPFLAACESGNVTIAKYLVEKGADVHRVSFEGYTALGYAVRSGNKAMIDYVLGLKLDTNARMDLLKGKASGVIERKRETALMQAVQAGNTSAVKQLMAAGADLRLTDWVEDDALAMAVRLGHKDIESMLRAALGDVYK
ncbi:MAG: ankyrin repeat domain-containing protein [Spirochaetales bacterium]|nr:ankyrin repeat domain-containing protein [Spirochaetales bacterium]